jgi:murein hydrolase activator
MDRVNKDLEMRVFCIKRVKSITLLLCSAFFLSSIFINQSLYAENSKTKYLNNLGELKKKISASETELSSLKKNSENAESKLSKVEKELEDLKNEEQKKRDVLKTLGTQIEALTFQIQDIQDQIEIKKKSFGNRVSHMYKSRRKLSSLSFLLVSTELNSFYRRADYLRRLVNNDNEQLQEYKILLETLTLTSRDMELLKEEEQGAQDRLLKIKSELLPHQLEAARLLKEVNSNLKRTEKLLITYKQEERELEEIIQNLTGGQRTSEPLIPPSVSFRNASLEFPVQGTVVQHFGKQKHDGFSDIIFVKGIEVASLENSPVRAVADGSVVFSSELPGFGNVIILEHSGAYYTLYGRIIPEKQMNESVEVGGVIGRTSKPDNRGRNFYFEIRKEGKPQNPEKYFANYK